MQSISTTDLFTHSVSFILFYTWFKDQASTVGVEKIILYLTDHFSMTKSHTK